MKTANNSRIVKKANGHLLLSTIRNTDRLTIEDMVQQTKMSRPTVLNILNEFLENNIVEKAGLRESMGGRQPVLYSLNLKSYFAVGVDFEFPPMRVVFANLKGEMVFSRYWYQEYGDTEDNVVDNIIRAIHEGLEALGIGKQNLMGIGLGMPGIINVKTNKAVRMPRMPETEFFAIDNRLEQEFAVPVFIRNDAHLLAMTDKESMTKANGSMLYIAYRTGIGMAVIERGRLSEGDFGNSGYIGHTTLDMAGGKCTCGKNGCLELYCSKRAIVQDYNNSPGAAKRQVSTFADVAALAGRGDEQAARVLSGAGRCFGIAIANAVELFDIPVVVIGDLECEDDSVFLQTIREVVHENTKPHSIEPVRVLHGKSEVSNYALGGCIFVIEHFFKAPKLTLNI